MNANPGRLGATVVGIIAVVAVFLLFLHPGSKPAPYRPPTKPRLSKGELRYSGQGNRTIARITVATTSEATFDCPACDNQGFSITSASRANSGDGLNFLSLSSFYAQFMVGAGAYSDVRVSSGGNPWTLTVTPDSG
jgi:hypothetical protein